MRERWEWGEARFDPNAGQGESGCTQGNKANAAPALPSRPQQERRLQESRGAKAKAPTPWLTVWASVVAAGRGARGAGQGTRDLLSGRSRGWVVAGLGVWGRGGEGSGRGVAPQGSCDEEPRDLPQAG